MKLMVLDGNSLINRAFYWRRAADCVGRHANQCCIWIFEYFV